MYRRFISFAFSLLILLGYSQAQEIPNQIDFCDVRVSFSPEVKEKLLSYVRQLQASPRYFNQMVKRAQIYLPFVHEAFEDEGVPRDLAYLAIQESALRADAVSSSQAVGFWQFKLTTAEEYGLVVNDRIDERKHIYRSSVAAARYLKKANELYDNWLYAMLTYYEGLTGSQAYTNSENYGKKSVLLTINDHWYIIKALAHKLAYQDAIQERIRPEIYLLPFSNHGETSINSLITAHKMGEAQFLTYNKWIVNVKKLPKGQNFTYYIPQSGTSYTGHQPDPNKLRLNQGEAAPVVAAPVFEKPEERPDTPTGAISQPTPIDPSVFTPPAIPFTKVPESEYILFDVKFDLHYGQEFILYEGNKLMAQLANEFSVSLGDLLVWNGLIPGEEPKPGTLLYLVKPSKADFHVVKKGESLSDIAGIHLMPISRIQNRNRMRANEFTIYTGQKLYLKDRRPKEEKPIVLAVLPEKPKPKEETTDKGELVQSEIVSDTEIGKLEGTDTTEIRPSVPVEIEENIEPETTMENVGSSETRWVRHIVSQGETLYQISKLYKTDVEMIKKINRLESDKINTGQILRILVRKK